jgi:hypothetical protein
MVPSAELIYRVETSGVTDIGDDDDPVVSLFLEGLAKGSLGLF